MLLGLTTTPTDFWSLFFIFYNLSLLRYRANTMYIFTHSYPYFNVLYLIPAAKHDLIYCLDDN